MVRFAGVEAGGTKVVIAAGTGPGDLTKLRVIPTTSPEETLSAVVQSVEDLGEVDGLGIGCFGPLDLRRDSASYGHITQTPKPGWSGTSVAPFLESELGIPVSIDTDVNGAALAEWTWGSAAGCDVAVYMTVGTGVGMGIVVHGSPHHGEMHPEAGHMLVPRRHDDRFEGICPFHGGCLEGLVAGPAIEARWARPPTQLGDRTSEAVEIIAWYVSAGIANLVLTLAPSRVMLGGGLMKLPGIHEATRRNLADHLAGYVGFDETRAARVVVPPALGERAGVLGAIALAVRVDGSNRDSAMNVSR